MSDAGSVSSPKPGSTGSAVPLRTVTAVSGGTLSAVEAAEVRNVVVVSGHLTDSPDRPTPRFPNSAVPGVRRAIRKVFAKWQIGPGDIVLCGGARGADLLAAEVALDRGAVVHLLLALPRAEFLAASVGAPGTAWVDRFNAVAARATVSVLSSPPPGMNVFEAVNEWMLNESVNLGRKRYALLVWDGLPGAAGGTSHVAQLVGASNFTTTRIDPLHPSDLSI